MNKLIIFFGVILIVGCTKIEPIDIVEPSREINTKLLEGYKSNLKDRDVVIGMIYGWGKLNQSNLMNTPDSLDVIVVKDGYFDISEHQKKDLKETQTKKATKVLLGVDFSQKIIMYEENLEREIKQKIANKKEEFEASEEALTEEEKDKVLKDLRAKIIKRRSSEVKQEMETMSSDILRLVNQNGFDGVSIEFSDSYNDDYTIENVQNFSKEISDEINKDTSKLLILENPSSIDETILKKANWVVFRQKNPTQLLSAMEVASKEFELTNFIPASDFSIEGFNKGFKDSERFPIPNQMYELVYWKSENKAGVAYYHIEKDYNDIVGNTTYNTLRTAINKTQLK